MASVKALREATSTEVRAAVLEDRPIGNLSARDFVRSTDMTLESYVEHIKGEQWVSPLEVHCAAKVLGVAVYLKVAGDVSRCGCGPLRGMLVLKSHHYMLYSVHRRFTTSEKHVIQRGGMQDAWTDWQNEIDEQGIASSGLARNMVASAIAHGEAVVMEDSLLPQPAQEQQVEQAQGMQADPPSRRQAFEEDPVPLLQVRKIEVMLDDYPGVQVNITTEESAGNVKKQVAKVVGVKDEELTISDADSDELPDWVQVPSGVRAKIVMSRTTVPLRVDNIRFDLHCESNSHEDMIMQIASMFRAIPVLIRTELNGSPMAVG